jgi:hypothetical protein
MTSKRRAVTEQGQRFIEKARELGCDEDPEAFERVFACIVPPKRPTKAPSGARVKKRRLKIKPPADQG